jgi:hypothetical protein
MGPKIKYTLLASVWDSIQSLVKLKSMSRRRRELFVVRQQRGERLNPLFDDCPESVTDGIYSLLARGTTALDVNYSCQHSHSPWCTVVQLTFNLRFCA